MVLKPVPFGTGPENPRCENRGGDNEPHRVGGKRRRAPFPSLSRALGSKVIVISPEHTSLRALWLFQPAATDLLQFDDCPSDDCPSGRVAVAVRPEG